MVSSIPIKYQYFIHNYVVSSDYSYLMMMNISLYMGIIEILKLKRGCTCVPWRIKEEK